MWSAGNDYLRASQSHLIREQLDNLDGKSLPPSGALTLRLLLRKSREGNSRLQELIAEGGFEHARRVANKRYVLRESQRIVDAMTGDMRLWLTTEQAGAGATDEDVTLVLAGAGTSKTAVIAGKAAHLISNRAVSPEHVLVLAFNRKAADELRQHLHTRHARVAARGTASKSSAQAVRPRSMGLDAIKAFGPIPLSHR